MITGNPDSDRKILLLLEHREFTSICTPPINKYINRICDEHFYRNLLYIKIPSHIQYKPSNVTHKKFYQIVINRIKNLLEILKIDWSTRCPFEVFIMEIHRPCCIYLPSDMMYYLEPNSKQYYSTLPSHAFFDFLEILETSNDSKIQNIYNKLLLYRNTITTIDLMIKIRIFYGKIFDIEYDYFDTLKEYQEEIVPLTVLTQEDFNIIQHEQIKWCIINLQKDVEKYLSDF